MNTQEADRGLFQQTILRIAKATMLSAIVLLIASALLIALAWRVLSHITINPQAISAAASDAVLITLAKGTSEQKLQTILALEKLGADAQPFVPALLTAAKESDPQIRSTAIHALLMIDPRAAKDTQDSP
jgi:HEAT repeat protein